jgi:ABC-type multidrug transport system permease subunit
MDLVNQDMKIREQLKEAYIKNKQLLSESQKYLIGKPNIIEEDLGKVTEDKHENKWAIGYFAQISVLFQRNWILTSKSQFSKLNCFQALCMSIVFGLFWLRMDYNEKTLRDRASFLYYMMMFWPLEVAYTGILSFPMERNIIEKERASGSFRLSTYYLAKCLSETPLKLVLPIISFIITYWMANMNPDFGIFLGILVFLLMIVLVAESLGLLFGASFHDIAHAWVAANIVLLGLLLAGGYFIENIPYWLIVWTKWLSFYKYGYDACLRLQFMGDRLYKCVNGATIVVCRNNLNGTFTGDKALKYFQVDLDIGLNFIVLMGMFITFRLAVYIALRFIKHRTGRT